jgi:hypothetical protein
VFVHENSGTLWVIPKFHHVIVAVRASHQMGLRPTTHGADVFYGSDNSIGGKQLSRGSLMSLCCGGG